MRALGFMLQPFGPRRELLSNAKAHGRSPTYVHLIFNSTHPLNAKVMPRSLIACIIHENLGKYSKALLGKSFRALAKKQTVF
jgi:hypothetical protein